MNKYQLLLSWLTLIGLCYGYNLEEGCCSCSPTISPTGSPSRIPTLSPSWSPTTTPTFSPSNEPTLSPSRSPTTTPTFSPTDSPSQTPTLNPSQNPSLSPTETPTRVPTDSPSQTPSSKPSSSPSVSPTDSPSQTPSSKPSISPTKMPSSNPTETPTQVPTNSPTTSPTQHCFIELDLFIVVDVSGSVRKHIFKIKEFVKNIAREMVMVNDRIRIGTLAFGKHNRVWVPMGGLSSRVKHLYYDAIDNGVKPTYDENTDIPRAMKYLFKQELLPKRRIDPHVKTVVLFISDGRPTRGKVSKKLLIKQSLEWINRIKGLDGGELTFISVGVGNSAVTFLKKISDTELFSVENYEHFDRKFVEELAYVICEH